MTVPVRALVVDDSASNGQLLEEELRRGGFDPVLERVTEHGDFEAALSGGSPIADAAAMAPHGNDAPTMRVAH